MTQHRPKKNLRSHTSKVLTGQKVESRRRSSAENPTSSFSGSSTKNNSRPPFFNRLLSRKKKGQCADPGVASVWDFRSLCHEESSKIDSACRAPIAIRQKSFQESSQKSFNLKTEANFSFEDEDRSYSSRKPKRSLCSDINIGEKASNFRLNIKAISGGVGSKLLIVLTVLLVKVSTGIKSLVGYFGALIGHREKLHNILRHSVVGIVRVLCILVSAFKLSVSKIKTFISYSVINMLTPLMYLGRIGTVLMCRWLKIHGMHGSPSLSVRKLRALTLVGVFQLATVLIVFRLFALQGSEHLKWEKIASRQQSRDISEKGTRGSIVDRNGLELAVSIPSISIGAHPQWIKDHDLAASKLSHITGVSQKELITKLKSDKQFIWLARGVSQSKEQEISRLKLFGIELEREYLRAYPQGNLASTIIGKAGRDGLGLSGIERSLNKQLLAPSITRSMQRDARGRLLNAEARNEKDGVALAHLKDIFEPQASPTLQEGGGVQLTLDAQIQSILEEEIDSSKLTSKAKHVFGVMMDANTGEVLAMGQSERADLSSKESQSAEQLRNIVLQNSFEPGSTFKPIVAAIALEHKVTRPDELINCENGRFPVGKYTIKDAHPVPTVSLEQVLVRSSNIGMTKLAFRLGKDTLYNDLREFGFGKQTNVGLGGEASGIFRNPSRWANIDVATHSFGQGISVTALQLVRAYAVLANGGYLVQPKLISDRNIPLEANPKLLSAKTAAFIRHALNEVTENEHGTGKNSRISGVPVYGKTGTAQKSKIGGVGYDSQRILASFIGFVDGKAVGVNKSLVLYIAVDEPGVWPRWGGTLAAPVFKKVMERTLAHYLLSEPESGARLAKVSSGQGFKPTL